MEISGREWWLRKCHDQSAPWSNHWPFETPSEIESIPFKKEILYFLNFHTIFTKTKMENLLGNGACGWINLVWYWNGGHVNEVAGYEFGKQIGMWSGVWLLEVRDLAFGGLHCGGFGDSMGSKLLFSFESFTLLLLYLANQVIFILLFTMLWFFLVGLLFGFETFLSHISIPLVKLCWSSQAQKISTR